MTGDADIAAAAALLAEPARAQLVLAVIERGPLPASELARGAGIARSTASEHLARLVSAGFLVAETEGRMRYFGLADGAVADAVEALAVVAPRRPVRSLREATTGARLRSGRTCYDHLAGRLGVALARALERERVIVRADAAYALGAQAEPYLANLGIDLAELVRQRRPIIRGCRDWTERDLHLAGSLGAALAERFFELGWIRRRDTNRSVEVTAVGRQALRRELGIDAGEYIDAPPP